MKKMRKTIEKTNFQIKKNDVLFYMESYVSIMIIFPRKGV